MKLFWILDVIIPLVFIIRYVSYESDSTTSTGRSSPVILSVSEESLWPAREILR